MRGERKAGGGQNSKDAGIDHGEGMSEAASMGEWVASLLEHTLVHTANGMCILSPQ